MQTIGNNLRPPKIRRTDANSIFLFTNARDEPNIAEWIAHHLLLGFNKIIIFDHLSKVPIRQTIGNKFGGNVMVIPVKGVGNIKLDLMNSAVNLSKQLNASWMLYLDADEFLLLNQDRIVSTFLRKFSQADSVGINWLMFGSSGNIVQPKGLITENFIHSEIRLNKHVKTFVRPYTVKSITNPHFYNIMNPFRCCSAAGTRMQVGPFNDQPLPFIKSPAYIAHYYIQSEEEHLRRKNRQMDDGTGVKHVLALADIKTIYNDVVNKQLHNKYSNRTKEFLKTKNIIF